MAGKYDSALKHLVEEYPEDFLDWLRRDATFKGILKTELTHRIIHADILLEAEEEGQRCAVHLEFQIDGDPQMAKRLWEYNVRATIQNDCPIYSYVIYLKNDVQLAHPPYEVSMPAGQNVHHFRFGVIDLAKTEPEDLQRLNLKALLPLLPLCHNGKRLDLVDATIARLAPPGEQPDTELLVFTLEFASLVFKEESEREQLRRRFSVFRDILHDTWVSQELIQEGEERGLKKGLEQGVQQGIQQGVQQGIQQGVQQGIQQAKRQELERQRQTILDIVLTRFPQIIQLTRKHIQTIEDPQILQFLIVKVSTVQTAEEVQYYLQEIAKNVADDQA